MALPVSIQIKDTIIAYIQDLESVQKVYPSAVINNDGWPAVSVTAQSEEGEFSSNTENSRIYTYNCIILFPVGQDYVPESERDRMDYAERIVAQVAEDISNRIDFNFELDGGVVLYVNAADFEWEYFQAEFGVARAVTVTLKVYTELNIID